MFKTITGVMQVPTETHILQVGAYKAVNNLIRIHTEAREFNNLRAILIQVIRAGEYKQHNNQPRIHTGAREFNNLRAIPIQDIRAGEYKQHNNQPRIHTEAREYKILHATQFQTIRVGVHNLLINKEINEKNGRFRMFNLITDNRDRGCLQVLLHKDHSLLQTKEKGIQEGHLTMTEAEGNHRISSEDL
jgi:chorismate mutase